MSEALEVGWTTQDAIMLYYDTGNGSGCGAVGSARRLGR